MKYEPHLIFSNHLQVGSYIARYARHVTLNESPHRHDNAKQLYSQSFSPWLSTEQALDKPLQCCPWRIQRQGVYYSMEIVRFTNESVILMRYRYSSQSQFPAISLLGPDQLQGNRICIHEYLNFWYKFVTLCIGWRSALFWKLFVEHDDFI